MTNLSGGVELLIVAALIGLLPAWIASRKGYPFGWWWLLGAAGFVIALPVSLMMKPNPEARQQCPSCRSWVDREASVCAHCGRDLPESAPYVDRYAKRPWDRDDA